MWVGDVAGLLDRASDVPNKPYLAAVVGLRLDARDDGIPNGFVKPSPSLPNRDDTGKAGCPSIENAPGR